MAKLRTGFTTGTYAATTALAAYRHLTGRRLGATLGVLFPDGRIRRVNLDGCTRTGTQAEAWARKDAGDDIDITDGAIIRARLSCGSPDFCAADHDITCGKSRLFLRGGSGVGRVVRNGLEVPPGKWAINSVPRQMMTENLRRAGLGDESGCWLLEISIDAGVELAAKTLNPRLGIVDGLSILGTSGIVIPCSNAAYIRTIEILLEGLQRSGGSTAVLVTGGKTHKAARSRYPELPEVAFIRIGDFIHDACNKAAALGLHELVLCCMPGKLAKYALGITYTHAHKTPLSMSRLLDLLRRDGIPEAELAKCRGVRSMNECLQRLHHSSGRQVLRALLQRASANVSAWAPGLKVNVNVLTVEPDRWLN